MPAIYGPVLSWRFGNRMWIFGIYDKKKLVGGGRVIIDKERVFEIIKRRPCKSQDLAIILGIDVNTVKKVLEELVREKRIYKVKTHLGEIYYTVKA